MRTKCSTASSLLLVLTLSKRSEDGKDKTPQSKKGTIGL